MKELDLALDNQPQIFYVRYCDDIIIASESEAALRHSLNLAEQTVDSIGLNFHPNKVVNGVFGRSSTNEFKSLESLDYLGYSVTSKGGIFISSSKLDELKKVVRETITNSFHAGRKHGHRTSRTAVVEIIGSVNRLLTGPTTHAYATLIKNFCNDDQSFRNLDRWIARQILGPVFKTRHDRVFRHLSYKQVREMGLRSLYHCRWNGEQPCQQSTLKHVLVTIFANDFSQKVDYSVQIYSHFPSFYGHGYAVQ